MHNTSQGPKQAQRSGAQHVEASSIDKLQDWQSAQASTASDMLEDSCWTDLPDLELTDSAGLQSELFASEVASSQSPSMFNLAEADFVMPQRLNSRLFSDHSESLADMDLESILADHDCMLRSTPDKQLQPNTPSASNNHLDDFLQQLYPFRSCSPASRETEQQGSQSQASAAALFQDNRMVPVRPASTPVEVAGCPMSNQQPDNVTAGQIKGVSSAKQETVKKPKIIVRLNIPASKKKTKGTQGRTPPCLTEKHPAAATEEREASPPVAKQPASSQQMHQLAVHETARKSKSHDVGTQTEFPSDSSSSNTPLEHPFTSAQALAEGTRLLMAALGGTFSSHQHAMQLSPGLRTAPWTLLTQSNIQLRLKPSVAAAGTQTEVFNQSTDLPGSSVARIHNAAAIHDSPQIHPEPAPDSATQLAMSSAAQRGPSQICSATRASQMPVSPNKKKPGAQKRLPPAIMARHASHYKLSPNAHLMFQCQGGAVSYALPSLQNSPKCHPADSLTPIRTSEKVNCRPSSVPCLSPASTITIPQPAPDAAIDHFSIGQAAVPAADPAEIQLPDANRSTSSCKSAGSSLSPLTSASRPVTGPSNVQPSLKAQDTTGDGKSVSLCRTLHPQEDTTLPNAFTASTAKAANVNIGSSGPSPTADKNNRAASAATNPDADAAGPKAPHVMANSKAAADVHPAATDATVTVSASPHSMGGVLDHPVLTAQMPAQSHGQDNTQPMTQLASSAAPAQAPSHPKAAPAILGRTLSAPKVQKATRPMPVPKAGLPGALQDQHHAAAAAPGNPAPELTPSPIPDATAVAATATSPKVANRSEPKSPIQVRTRGKLPVDAKAKQQLGCLSPSTADALRSDLVSTAGCHVTRRLVHHLLEPILPPTDGAKACSQPARGNAVDAGRTAAKAAQPLACQGKGKAGTHSQAPQAGRLPGSSTASLSGGEAAGCKQPPQASKASGALAPTNSRGKTPNADQGKQAGKDKHKPPELKSAAVKEQKQSTPPLAAPAGKATKSKATTQKATDVKLESKHASLPKAGKTCSILELNQQQTIAGTAITPVTDKKKAGNSTAAGKQPAADVTVVSSSTPDEHQAGSSNKTTASSASRAAGIKPSGSVSRSKESQPTYSSATQSQSGLKRLQSDASAAAPPAKKHKSACATAAGLNPKFMATKDAVLKLIGDREGVLEAELRRSMGNNPDTSKALRKLHKEGALQRSGAGGRPDPFKWTRTPQSQA